MRPPDGAAEASERGVRRTENARTAATRREVTLCRDRVTVVAFCWSQFWSLSHGRLRRGLTLWMVSIFLIVFVVGTLSITCASMMLPFCSRPSLDATNNAECESDRDGCDPSTLFVVDILEVEL